MYIICCIIYYITIKGVFIFIFYIELQWMLLSLLFIINLFLIIWIIIHYISLIYLVIILFLFIWILIINWCNDLLIESIILLTTIEHYLIIIGIKLMLISELMLFISCFWCVINIRLMSGPLSLFFIIPFISCNAFSIPFTNLIILLYSSYPLNGSQLALKSGDLLIILASLFIILYYLLLIIYILEYYIL